MDTQAFASFKKNYIWLYGLFKRSVCILSLFTITSHSLCSRSETLQNLTKYLGKNIKIHNKNAYNLKIYAFLIMNFNIFLLFLVKLYKCWHPKREVIVKGSKISYLKFLIGLCILTHSCIPFSRTALPTTLSIPI
jgi:hypothetical protein